MAAVVPIDLLHRYQRLEDREAMRLVQERMASPEPGIPMEEVVTEVLAEPG